MARTVFGTSDGATVKHYSAAMFMEAIPKSFFLKKFIGKAKKTDKNRTETDPDYPIQMLTDLENDSGDAISYDLFMRAKGQGVEGDNVLRGNEEKLVKHTDTVKIDQLRHGVDCGGKMSRKRTRHNLREIAKSNLSGWWAERFDELLFMYLAGDRGDDTNIWVLPSTYTSFAGNTATAPESTHMIYGGDATSTATVDANDKFTIDLIDKAIALAEMTTPLMRPCMIDGEAHFICVLHSYCAYDLWTNEATGQWPEIVKAAEKRGKDNPIFKGGDVIGLYKNVILMKHPKVPRNKDWGSGSNVYGARNLFLGAQAGVIAFGSPGNGFRFSWHEEEEDRGNVQVIDTGAMFGVKKCIFNSLDNAVVTINTACANPNSSTGA